MTVTVTGLAEHPECDDAVGRIHVMTAANIRAFALGRPQNSVVG